LHVSQPTLSQQIRQLEDTLHAPLLDRTGRTIVLTDAGVDLSFVSFQIASSVGIPSPDPFRSDSEVATYLFDDTPYDVIV
jgi:Bacterial regulatory helix-turn-helix protein, lysR family